MRHVTHVNILSVIPEVISHIQMNPVTHMNESCHTRECVMSHISTFSINILYSVTKTRKILKFAGHCSQKSHSNEIRVSSSTERAVPCCAVEHSMHVICLISHARQNINIRDMTHCSTVMHRAAVHYRAVLLSTACMRYVSFHMRDKMKTTQCLFTAKQRLVLSHYRAAMSRITYVMWYDSFPTRDTMLFCHMWYDSLQHDNALSCCNES